jgi:hypothetical protein
MTARDAGPVQPHTNAVTPLLGVRSELDALSALI